MDFSLLLTLPPLVGAFIAALAGLVWGSFVTMASYRLPRGEGLVFTPSHCPHCDHRLHTIDLVPVFSWLLSKGKCRYCRAPISTRYPLTELSLAAIFFLIYSQLGFSLLALLLSLIAVCLLIIIVTDLEHYIIPDQMQWMLLILALPYGLLLGKTLLSMVIGTVTGIAIGLALRFLCSAWKKQEALGWGDVKFLGIVGLYLGITPLPAFFFLSGIAGILTAMLWNFLGKGKLFPFAPALVVALFIMLLFPGTHLYFTKTITELTVFIK